MGTTDGLYRRLKQEFTFVFVPSENAPVLASGLEQALNRSWDAPKLRQSVQYLSWDDVGRSYHQILAGAVSAASATVRAVPDVSPILPAILD